MKNVQMTVEGHRLTITVDLSKEFGASASGKTIIIASTEGSVSVPDREEKVGLNVIEIDGVVLYTAHAVVPRCRISCGRSRPWSRCAATLTKADGPSRSRLRRIASRSPGVRDHLESSTVTVSCS